MFLLPVAEGMIFAVFSADYLGESGAGSGLTVAITGSSPDGA